MNISTSVKYFLRLSILPIYFFNVMNAQVPDSIRVEPGWNLISLPLSINNSIKTSIFPTATSDAFIFQNSYIAKDTLENGYGFWLKFDSAQSINVMGDVSFEDSISVYEGWNIIGSLTFPIPFSDIQTNPQGIIISDAFGYSQSSGYQSVDTLRPGQGYWIKFSQNGSIVLSWKGYIFNDSTKQPESYPNFVSVSLDSNQVILTYASENDLPTFTPGEILVGDSAGGYARKVIGSTINGNQLIIETETATLEEAVDYANIDTTFILKFPDLAELKKLLGKPIQLQGKSGGKTYSITSSAPLIRLSPNDDQITLDFPDFYMEIVDDGYITMRVDMLTFSLTAKILKFKFRWPSNYTFQIIYELTHEAHYDNMQVVIDGPIEIPSIRPLIINPIIMEEATSGIVGWTLKPTFNLSIILTPSIPLDVGLESNGTMIIGGTDVIGFEHDAEDTSPVWDPSVSGSNELIFAPTTAGFAGEVKVFLEPEINCTIGGIGRVDIFVKPYGYNQISHPPLTVEAGAGVSGGVSADNKWISEKLFPIELTMKDEKWQWFIQHEPAEPSNPSPENSAIDVPLSPSLIWTCSDPDGDPLTYDVYFGLNNPPTTIVSSNQSSTSLVRSNLTEGLTYYWIIVAKDVHGYEISGPVWSFTTASSGSGLPCVLAPSTVTYASKIYNTVRIGSQCWLKENLDVGTMINGSISQIDNGLIEKYCYNNDPSYCNTYGGLYQWNEAMKYTNTERWVGICPGGWHIPSLDDFIALWTAVAGDGNALKAIGESAGTNTSGFSALLAGYGFMMKFDSLGELSYIWSSTDSLGWGTLAQGLGDDLWGEWVSKNFGYSVRCIKNSLEPSSNPNPDDGATDVSTSLTLSWPRIYPDYYLPKYNVYMDTYGPPGTLISHNQTDTSFAISGLSEGMTYYWMVVANDSSGESTSGPVWSFITQSGGGSPCQDDSIVLYEGKIYHTVPIGNQCWLKENLNVGIVIQGSDTAKNNGQIEKYCYGNDTVNCNAYGGFYQWNETMHYNTTPGSQGICPLGWHIPTLTELQTLDTTVESDGNTLKAVGQGTGAGAGTNTSGFSALLGGYRDFNNGSFYGLGDYTFIWSSSEDNSTSAFNMALYNNSSLINLSYSNSKDYGFNVRCLKD